MTAAMTLVRRIVAAYPNGGMTMGDPYYGAAAAALMAFDLEVARSCADLKAGIVTSSDFIPSAAAIRKWCEARANATSPRTHALLPYQPEPDRSQRLSYHQLNAKYGDGAGGWGLPVPKPKPSPFASIDQLKALAGKAWDKIPDADQA
jgi:hypothetical protein